MNKGAVTKQRILKNAEKLFAEHSYSSVSLQDLATSSNVTKSSLYHFFKNKKELYFSVLEVSFADLEKQLLSKIENSNGIQKKIRDSIDLYLSLGMQRKNRFSELNRKASDSEQDVVIYVRILKEKLIGYFESLFREAHELAILNIHNAKLSSYLLVGVMDSFLADSYFYKSSNWTPKKVVQQMVDILFSQKGPSLC